MKHLPIVTGVASKNTRAAPAIPRWQVHPLDVLLLLDESVPPGCLVKARLIGAIEARQTEPDGKQMRNDRLLAVALHAHTHQHIKTLDDLRAKLLDEIEEFFIDYHKQRGGRFKPIRHGGPRQAAKLLKAGIAPRKSE